jgi:hypothetical protein
VAVGGGHEAHVGLEGRGPAHAFELAVLDHPQELGLQLEGQLAVWASKDPDGANLDRIQIVKGWVDANGEPQDRVFDVVWSGNRKPDAKGKIPAVGNTVDVTRATYTNTIGSAELMSAWTDPEFDPAQHAIYYVRVLEIPTPRFTTYDAVRNNLPLLKDVPATLQERAWSSPVWYSPSDFSAGSR